MAKVYAQGRCPAYKISKAALNMLTVQYAQDYAAEGYTFLAVSPGVSIWNSCRLLIAFANSDKWLRTDLGSSYADLPVETGAEKVVDIVKKASPEQNGKFVTIHVPGWEKAEGNNQYPGGEVPW